MNLRLVVVTGGNNIMEQYINKTAVVAMIKHHIKEELHSYFCKCLLSEIDALETKEVDLEKEIKNYLDEQPIVARSQGIDYKLVPSPETIAKHFFELGLKAQKGE